ncbi:MAG: 2OG-Fe(II) oxygenase [Bacteroidetes bacterium]|nr:2OG-Fe(II) oxygenase [Bacteroidota bacterium]
MLHISKDNSILSIDKVDKELVRAFNENYSKALPYPHIVIDNFLPEFFIDKIIQHFPSKDEATVNHKSNTQYLKSGYRPHLLQANPCSYYISLLNTAPVLEFLEDVTGINGLIPDPYYEGGGLHQTERNGRLDVHADFTLHKKTGLARRVNMLIFLNKDWKPEYGGNLELWDRKMKQKQISISPVYNRCVIFNTDDTSFHGQPEPVNCPPEMSRRSIALYYYTAPENIDKLTVDTKWRSIVNASMRQRVAERLRGLFGKTPG